MRERAEFRALRELTGITQANLAEMLDVKVRAIKHWERENDEGYNYPPDDAWNVLDEAYELQQQAIDTALKVVDDVTEKLGNPPDCVEVSYWLSNDDFLDYSTDSDFDICGSWTVANANARAVASVLESQGIMVKFVNGATSAVVDAKNNQNNT